jgi:hypothetical protein
MDIEVAVPQEYTTKQRGDLLEDLVADFMKAQGYEVEQEVRITASELDLLCKNKINKKVIYVECKAYRDTLSANILTQLLGTVVSNNYQEGWLISTGHLGKDAKGFKSNWEEKPIGEAQRLSIYTPERVIEALINSKLVKMQPQEKALELLKNEDLLGNWTLLVTPYGRFWTITCLSGGVPEGVLIFSATTGSLIEDQKLLRNISKTDASIRNLDFEFISRVRQLPLDNLESTSVVEVQYGNSWSDYRPARPQDFVGRTEAQDSIIHFLEQVRSCSTDTRVFAITGDSGMGKSSLINKLRERAQNQRNRNRFFIYAVDVRAATNATYIFSALLSCFRKAVECGFGDESQIAELKITNINEPLESPSIRDYLNRLEQNDQIVCLIFDQFEEFYSKSDLFSIFELAQRLLLSVTSARSNFVLGFAWKSDSTVPQSHPAYFMWHSLSDHRLQIELKRFRHDEASAAITLFEKELGGNLLPNLKRQLLESTQGYPWWLKKLSIHVYEQIRSGISQSELLDKTLDIESLFKKDLQKLTSQEHTCLKNIAENAPADWVEMLDAFGKEVLQALMDKRLIIRSGSRITIYWDIFREYVVSGKIPSIPITYLPSYQSLNTVLMIATQLSKETPRSYDELSKIANIKSSTTLNVVHDLMMYGVATKDFDGIRLDQSVQRADTESVLRRLRQILATHAVTLSLKKLERGFVISQDEMVEILQQINPTAQHTDKTWKAYSDRISRWLAATGFVSPDAEGFGMLVEDRGDINPEFTNISVGYYADEHFFIGDSSPAYAMQALQWLIGNPNPVTSWSEFYSNGLRNAAQSLRNLGIIATIKGRYAVTAKYKDLSSPLEILWKAANEDKTLQKARGFLKKNPAASGRDLGTFLNRDFERNWSDTSIDRIGNSLRQWAHWIIIGETSSNIPEPLGARYKKASDAKQGTLFDNL